jgi:hypothetical protein
MRKSAIAAIMRACCHESSSFLPGCDTLKVLIAGGCGFLGSQLALYQGARGA